MVKYVYLHTPNIIPAVSRKYTYGYSRISIILKAINYPYFVPIVKIFLSGELFHCRLVCLKMT